MKTTQAFNRSVVILALILAGCSLLLSNANAVQIVASPDISDSSLTSSDIENLFLGKKKSLPGGQKVKVVTLKGGDAHDSFLGAYVSKSSSQFSAYWKRKIVDGTGIPPKSFATEQDLIDYIKSNSNVIGYASDGVTTEGTKVIQIQ